MMRHVSIRVKCMLVGFYARDVLGLIYSYWLLCITKCNKWRESPENLNMSAYSICKKKILGLKYWAMGYSKSEKFIRHTLSNYETDALKEVGLLISAAFMDSIILNQALKIALQRLDASDSALFPKHVQYYKALLFIQKVCMVSSVAESEVKKHHVKILSFAFYRKDCCSLDISIRISSTAILKQINKSNTPKSHTHTTFITCLSHSYINDVLGEV
ncbi:hypothetical protein NEPAR04_0804 [Nematocida parisii]|nr:hypothetical protein NEPAR08_0973 [Nematocida parisii]KAI5129512.1 hypothetical protein NEPAR03_1675 [Nematocida parisii]KAI5141234.1 hypothetical protein NEPAR04_0804 [Nematocida parisii]